MPVPNTFANATATIPLTQLDANFATTITLGNTAIQLGNTVTTLNNMTLANVNISSGIVTITNASVTTANVTTANIATATIATANVSGNLTFTGTGNRITGDFSNATIANRVLFQTSTVNGVTSVSAVNNGTGTGANFSAYAQSDPNNSSRAQFAVVPTTDTRISSDITGTGTYLPMTLYTSGTEKLRIAADATGTYTFGGTAPRITGDFSNATVANRVMFQTSTVNGLTSLDAMPNGTSQISVLNLWNSSDPINAARIQVGALSTEARLLTDKTGTGSFLPMTFYTGGSETMRIDTSGNVGIGTSLPGPKLDVNGVIRSTGTSAILTVSKRSTGTGDAWGFYSQSGELNLYDYTAAASRMVIDSSGNVGIGTSTPAYALEVKRTGSISQIAATSDTTAAYSYARYNSGATNVVTGIISDPTTGYISVETNHPLVLRTNATERMRIDASGNVGIGTSSPNVPLTLGNSKTLGWPNASGGLNGTTTGSQIFKFSDNNLYIDNYDSGTSIVIRRNNNAETVRIDGSGYTQFLGNLVMPYQGAPTSKAAAATLTGAELVTGILNTTGTTYTITLPTGTNIEGALTWAGNNACLDFFVINTASGTITIGANGNTTLGGLTIATGTSAHFRIRRTAVNTFTVYRI